MKDYSVNDPTFLKAIKNGDEEAFTFLVREYNEKLFAYAMSLINDKAMAEDLVQNVFLKTFERRKQLKITKSLLNFLYKSIYNEFINQYRKNKALVALEKRYVETLDEIIDETDTESTERLIGVMRKEIEKLPKKCKRIFLLSKEEGLTNIEIAEYLELSVKTVEAQIAKAFSRLRKKMNKRLLNILLFFYKINLK
ncbi:RNA polymerase sigma-70 factor [Flavobacteriaceae bacterium F08102]|nr:RNA polymerase sigma-70 factor [Flavobacteriaceae bacterium F08102]